MNTSVLLVTPTNVPVVMPSAVAVSTADAAPDAVTVKVATPWALVVRVAGAVIARFAAEEVNVTVAPGIAAGAAFSNVTV